jgi:hypothetical protein
MYQITTTENGAASIDLTTFGSNLVAYFFKALRDADLEQLRGYLRNIWSDSPMDCVKIIFWTRDFRGNSGCKGERKVFLDAMKWLSEEHTDIFKKLLKFVPEYGRWKDLLELWNLESDTIAQLFIDQLRKDKDEMDAGRSITLCAKWFPSENGKYDVIYRFILSKMFITSRCLRKEYLVPLRAKSEVVESIIPEWEKINYSHVPAIAMKNLKNAFLKHDEERFQEYLRSVQRGETKINTGTLYPYQIIHNYTQFDQTLEVMWKDFVEKVRAKGTLKNMIPVCDVSGSMIGLPIEVCISLGLLLSEINTGTFANKVLTFHEKPSIFTVKGETLLDRVNCLMKAPWGGHTNFQATIDLLLQELKKTGSTEQHTIIVFSDMQFDEADNRYQTNHNTMLQKFAKAGIPFPRIVYWNLRGNTVDFPTCSWDQNVALVSGFNANIFDLFVDTNIISPYLIVRNAIDNPRYQPLEEVFV